MDVDPDALHRLDPAYGKHPDMAALVREEGRRLNENFRARFEGAQNLLMKAHLRRAGGEEERAAAFVRRAAEMAYDEREIGWPGILSAGQLVHDLVVDEFEDSDWEDSTWLDRVVTAVEPLTGPGRAATASAVHGIVLQTAFYDTLPAERRRIVGLFGDAPLETDHGLDPGSSLEERIAVLDSLLEAYAALLHELVAESLARPPARR